MTDRVMVPHVQVSDEPISDEPRLWFDPMADPRVYYSIYAPNPLDPRPHAWLVDYLTGDAEHTKTMQIIFAGLPEGMGPSIAEVYDAVHAELVRAGVDPVDLGIISVY